MVEKIQMVTIRGTTRPRLMQLVECRQFVIRSTACVVAKMAVKLAVVTENTIIFRTVLLRLRWNLSPFVSLFSIKSAHCKRSRVLILAMSIPDTVTSKTAFISRAVHTVVRVCPAGRTNCTFS